MELHEYVTKKEEDVKHLINSPTLKNQYGQIFAKKMEGQFQATYSESTIWGYALFLSSASAKVLKSKSSIVCTQGLKIAAEIFETFSLMSEEYDRDYSKILSALCYDLSGYQANAICILRSLDYKLEENSSLDNSINELLKIVTLLLKRKLQAIPPLSSKKVPNSDIEKMDMNWKIAIDKFRTFQLSGQFINYEEEIAKAINSAINLRDATLTTILALLELKMQISYQRTTWTVLSNEIDKSPDIWKPYLSLLASNPYKDDHLVPPENRLSQVELWKSQIAAVHSGVLENNKGFVIQMPTSAGKTLIAELAILQQISTGNKCIYIAPFRSLVTEIESSLSEHLAKLGYLVSSLTGSFEIDELDHFWLREADVLVATPEKIDFLIRVRPELFNDISLFVIDEGHVLGNLDNRSAQFELLLTRLKRWFIPKGCRFIFISAVMPDSDGDDFAKWLLADEQAKIQSPTEYDGSMWQPTRRLLGSFKWNGNNGKIEFKNYVQSTDTIYIPNFISPLRWEITRGKKKSFPNIDNKSETAAFLAYRYLRDGSVLIYCATVGRRKGGGVYSVLRAFDNLINILDENFEKDSHFPVLDDSEALEASIRWYGEDNIITKCIKRGIAPHFGDLADEVRRAVEKEYTQKKIKILVATHTLGQGVNLPIKTLLVYSLDINPNPRERISVKVRDFWNIVGRAGRAGRETEGQVVFIVNSYRDNILYNKYRNVLNSERVRSIFAVAMELYRAGRISKQALEEVISEISEPALMNFLVEEVVDTPDQQLMESFIGDTLFKIQAIDEDPKSINNILFSSANRFWSIETRERKIVFSKTGLSLNSCKVIEETLRSENKAELNNLFTEGNEETFLKVALKCLSKCNEMEEKKALKDVPILGNNKLEIFINAWVKGANLDELRLLWIDAVGEKFIDLMNVYIEDCLAYRYPWGVTSVIFIASFVLECDWNSFSKEILNYPSKLKYGLSEQYALWLRGVGILSREVCVMLSKGFDGNSDIREFTRWFLNISLEEIHTLGITSKYSIRNIFNVVTRLNLKDTNSTKENQGFTVKGIRYESSRVELAKKLKEGDKLILKRQFDNKYDPFAIQVFSGNLQLGFVPRELAKSLSFQIDILQKDVECFVNNKFGNTIQAIAIF